MNSEIKQRIKQIKNGEIPDGYRSTKAGVLPKWDCVRLNQIAEPITKIVGNGTYETLSISAGIGFVNQAKKFGKELSGKQYEKYTVLNRGDFSYNKGNSKTYPQGCIYRLKDRETAAVPNVFESFKIKKDSPDYYEQLFTSGYLNKQLSKKINHGVRDDGLLNLTGKDFYSCYVPHPPIAEQQKIAEILMQCDKLIELYQNETYELQKLKKICLCKMFPKNGNNVPEWRFPQFTDAWEQRKFSDVVATRRGLTYKPSDIRKNGVRVLRSSNIAEDSFTLSDEDVFVVREAVHIDCARANDILITAANGSSRLVGKHTIISGIPEESAVHGGFMILGTTKEPHFVNASMGSSWYRRFIELFVAGGNGAIGNLNKNDLDNQEIAIPSEKEQKKIGSFFRQLDDLITLHQRKLAGMKKQKKSLTQLLLTGIVRVSV